MIQENCRKGMVEQKEVEDNFVEHLGRTVVKEIISRFLEKLELK